MVSRRGLLLGIGVGAAGTWVVTGGEIPSEVPLPNQRDEDAEQIKRVEKVGPFSDVTFYDDGFAELTLPESHEAGKVGITHANHDRVRSNSYRRWDAPEFSGPLEANVRQVVKNNGPYPSAKFRFGLLADDQDERYLIRSTKSGTVVVPDSYMPEE
jgi:hypothetical protein